MILMVCSAELALIGLQNPNDLLLLVVSNNPFIIVLRLLLVLGALVLAFKKRFEYKYSREIVGGIGALLMIFGICGMFSQAIADDLSVYIKYLDFWMFCLFGLVFTLASLTLQPGSRQLNAQKAFIQHMPKTWVTWLNPHSLNR
jgi:hypothetical protein